MNPITETGGAHYYAQTGDPRYGATLREARKENYFPSITTILGSWPSGYLADWITFEVLKARHNNPPKGAAKKKVITGEDLTEEQQEYFKKIVDISHTVRDDARDRGNEIHEGGEAMLLGKPWNKKDESLNHLWKWFKDNLDGPPYWTERSLVNLDLRVAGRADGLIRTKGDERPLLIDFKGRKFDHGPRKGWRAKRYAKDLIQLAFYASTMPDPPRIANIYIHREAHCPVEVAEYTDAERDAAFEMVKHVAAIWFYDKKYHPEVNHEDILAHLENAAPWWHGNDLTNDEAFDMKHSYESRVGVDD